MLPISLGNNKSRSFFLDDVSSEPIFGIDAACTCFRSRGLPGAMPVAACRLEVRSAAPGSHLHDQRWKGYHHHLCVKCYEKQPFEPSLEDVDSR
ncbi:hypothetical protein NC653_026092 [Populus alba x Populus x berolinensis]|uniref:Uncharacterized protein n=2 Tax=Populus alba x Populus x berolinensis TaxID=444605 RepID=A0AAD6MDP0_9ROSI|nr:hypothetical protein NC653_026092 [Populus alba x Populus x berolinensis]